jgi:hypothetical protein
LFRLIDFQKNRPLWGVTVFMPLGVCKPTYKEKDHESPKEEHQELHS